MTTQNLHTLFKLGFRPVNTGDHMFENVSDDAVINDDIDIDGEEIDFVIDVTRDIEQDGSPHFHFAIFYGTDYFDYYTKSFDTIPIIFKLISRAAKNHEDLTDMLCLLNFNPKI